MIATLKRARFMPGDAAKKLEAAIASLREMCVKYSEIEQFHRDAAALLSSYQARAKAAQSDYSTALSNRDLPAMKQALEVWLPLRAVLDFARHEEGNLHAQGMAGSVLGQLVRDYGDPKPVMLAVCELKLAAAQADAERVTETEAKRLGPEYGPDDLAASPVTRRVNSNVARLEAMQRRLESEQIQSVWSLANQLLDE
jgi:hypothetical protein